MKKKIIFLLLFLISITMININYNKLEASSGNAKFELTTKLKGINKSQVTYSEFYEKLLVNNTMIEVDFYITSLTGSSEILNFMNFSIATDNAFSLTNRQSSAIRQYYDADWAEYHDIEVFEVLQSQNTRIIDFSMNSDYMRQFGEDYYTIKPEETYIGSVFLRYDQASYPEEDFTFEFQVEGPDQYFAYNQDIYVSDDIKVNNLIVGDPNAAPDSSLSSLDIRGTSPVDKEGTLKNYNSPDPLALSGKIHLSYQDSIKGLNIDTVTNKDSAVIKKQLMRDGNLIDINSDLLPFVAEDKIVITVSDGPEPADVTIYERTITVEGPKPNNEIQISTNKDDLGVSAVVTGNNISITVPYSVKELVIYGTTIDYNATINKPSLSVSNLTEGENLIDENFVVTAEDGNEKPYSITITQEIGDSNTNIDLSVNNGDILLLEGENIYNYTLPEALKRFNFKVVTQKATSSIQYKFSDEADTSYLNAISNNSVYPNIEIDKGKTIQLHIKITAENGNSTIYELNITREQSSNNDVGSLELTEAGGIAQELNLVGSSFAYTIKNNYADNIVLRLSGVENENQTVKILNKDQIDINKTPILMQDILDGPNEFTIVVTSETGVENSLSLTIYKKSDKNDLVDIKLQDSNGYTDIAYFSDFNRTTNTFVYNLAKYSTLNQFKLVLESANNSKFDGTNSNIMDIAYIFNNNGQAEKFERKYTVIAENGNDIVYTIVINRPAADNNALLDSISLDDVPFTEFSSNKFIYDKQIVVNRDVSNITISGVAQSDLSKTQYYINNIEQPNGYFALTQGKTNTIEIRVTAESGDVNKYIIKIIPGDESNQINDITLNNIGQDKFIFKPDVYSYEFDVPYSIKNTRPVVDASSHSTVTGISDYTLIEGKYITITIFATSETGVKGLEYKIKIRQNSSRTIKDLSSLVYTPQNGQPVQLIPGEVGKTSFSFRVDNDIEYIDFSYKVEGSNGEFIQSSISGNVREESFRFNLKSGKNIYNITVIDEGNRPKIYQIEITRQNNNFNFTTVTFGRILEDKKTYSVHEFIDKTLNLADLPYKTDQIDLSILKEDPLATILTTGQYSDGKWNLDIGDNTLTFQIKSEFGELSEIYTINVKRESPNQLNELESLSILVLYKNGTTNLIENINSNKLQKLFNLRVDRNVSKITVIAKVNKYDRSILVDFGTGTVENDLLVFKKDFNNILDGSVTPLNIKVKAEDDSLPTNDYSINVLSKNAIVGITSFEIKNGNNKINEVFDNANLGDFSFNIKALTISIEKEDRYSRVYINGVEVGVNKKRFTYDLNLSDGFNNIEIEVKTEVDTEDIANEDYLSNLVTYTYKRNEPSTNAELEDLKVMLNGVDILALNKPFISSTHSYSFVIPRQEFKNVTLIASAKDNGTIPPLNIGTKSFGIGENKYVINVIAEDGKSSSEYEIIIHQNNTDNSINNIMANGESLTPGYSSDITEYTLPNIKYDVKNINFNVIKSDEFAKIFINGNEYTNDTNLALTEGTNIFVVFAKSDYGEDGVSYTITVNREAPNQFNDLAALSILVTYNNSTTKLIEDIKTDDLKKIFNLRVDRNVSKITVIAKVNKSDRSVVVGFGAGVIEAEYLVFKKDFTNIINGNVTTLNINIKAEDDSLATNDYSINVLSKNAIVGITSFEIKEGVKTISSVFENANLGEFSFNVKTFIITIEKEDRYSRVYINGIEQGSNSKKFKYEYNLLDGDNIIDIEVKTEVEEEDIANKDYLSDSVTYTYKRNEPSTNAELEDLKVMLNGVDILALNKPFISSTHSYTFVIPRQEFKNVIIIANAKDNGTIPALNIGSKSFGIGENKYVINVIAEDGSSSSEYTIIIHQNNIDNKINNITANGEELSPGYSTDVTEYLLPDYNYDVANISFNIEKNDDFSKIFINGNEYSNDTNLTLADGINEFIIFAKSDYGEDGTKYLIRVNRTKAFEDVNLQDLEVTDQDGSLIAFDSGFYQQGTYNYRIELSETSKPTKINVIYLLINELKQSIDPIDMTNIVLNYSKNGELDQEVKFTVSAEANSSQIYTIRITKGVTTSNDTGFSNVRVEDSNKNDYITQVGSVDAPYLATVPYKWKNVNIVIDLYNDKADYNPKGVSLVNKETIVNFVITAEDGTKSDTYTIIITREDPSNDALLEDIVLTGNIKDSNGETSTKSIIGIEGIKQFSSNKFTYNITLDRTYKSIDLSFTKSDSESNVQGPSGHTTISPNIVNTRVLKVTAEDGTTRDYTINIIVKDNDAEVLDIDVDIKDILFSPDQISYDLGKISKEFTEMIITVEKSNQYATVLGDGLVKLKDGINIFKVFVTSEDGLNENMYEIKLDRELAESDSTLSNLTITGEETINGIITEKLLLGPNTEATNPEIIFNPETYTYDILINRTFKHVNIDYKLSFGNAVSNDIRGRKKLSPGETNTYIIEVIAEDLSKSTYTINITVKDSDARVLNIKTDIKEIIFDKDVLIYDLEYISKKYIEMLISVEKANEYATIKGDGLVSLKDGINVFNIIVTSEDGLNESIYEIILNREIAENDSTLANLKVVGEKHNFDSSVSNELLLGIKEEGKTPKIEFDPQTHTYNILVDRSFKYIDISYEVGFANANGSGQTGRRSLEGGKTTSFEIKVTAENGDYSVYKVNITVKDNDDSVLDITLDIDSDFVFNKDELSYNLGKVSKEHNKIKIDVSTNNEFATVTINNGNNHILDLKDGINTFIITSTSEDGKSSVTYTIKLDREPQKSSDTSFDDVIVEDMFGAKYNTTVDENNDKVYTVTVPYKVTNVDVVINLLDDKAIYTPKARALVEGENIINIIITAEDGTKCEEYKLIITRDKAADDAELSDLTLTNIADGEVLVGKENLSPTKHEFLSNVYFYEFNLDRSYRFLDLTFELSDKNASTNMEEGTIFLIGGTVNQIRLQVRSQSGKVKTYIIVITVKNSDISIDNITAKVDNVNKIEYNPTTFEYDLGTVKGNVASIDLDAKISDNFGKIDGIGRQTLNTGLNEFLIRATSEDESTTIEYIIKIFKEAGSTGELGTDTRLHNLEVTEALGDYNLQFTQEVTEYELNLEYKDARVWIKPTFERTGTISNEGFISLKPGETKQFVYQVTAQNKQKGIAYTLTVSRELGDDDNQLNELYVEELEIGTISPLDVTKDYHEVRVSNDTKQIRIVANGSKTMIISGNEEIKTLQTREDIFIITVESETGVKKTHVIKVIKEDDNTFLEDLTVSYVKNQNEEINLSLSPSFDKNITTYTIDLNKISNKSIITTLNIEGTAESAFSRVEGNGIKTLKSGTGATTDRFTIKVVADNGTSKTYTIIVTRNVDPKDSIVIEDLTLNGEGHYYMGMNDDINYEQQFVQTTYTYNVSVPYSLNNIHLSVINNDGASIYGAGTHRLSDKETIIEFRVVSNSGNITSQTYKIIITKQEASGDNTLRDLKIDSITLEDFNPNRLNYDIDLIYSEDKEYNIQAFKNNEYAMVSGNIGNVTINHGTNIISIKVTAENGLDKYYTIRINAKSDENEILHINIDGEDLNPVFNTERKLYEVSVKYDVSRINVQVIASKYSTVIGDKGIVALEEGANNLYIRAQSEYGTIGSIYTIVVTRAKISNDATLESLVVTNPDSNTNEIIPFDPVFNSGIFEYTINLQKGSGIENIYIDATANNEYAIVGGKGFKVLRANIDGEHTNVFEIVVRAQSGDTLKYTLFVYHDADLSDATSIDSFELTANDGTVYLGTSENSINRFEKNKKTYHIKVPYNVRSLSANMVPGSGRVSGNGTKSFNMDDVLKFEVTITSISGKNSETYKITVERENPIIDNSLSGITIDGKLIPGFNSEKLHYEIEVDKEDSNRIILGATASNPSSIIYGDLNVKELEIGRNTFTISVQSEDGNIKSYVIVVNYVTGDATLEELFIKDTATDEYIDFGFDSNKLEYDVIISKNTQEVIVTGVASDLENAKILGNGRYTISKNIDNKIYIYVTAGDGVTEKRYVLNLIADDVLSNNTLLKDLQVENHPIAFNKDRNGYTLSVNSKVSNVILNFSPQHSKAVVEVLNGKTLSQGSSEVELKAGQNAVLVKVTAEDGSVGFYNIDILKDPEPDMFLTVLLILSLLLWVITILVILIRSTRDNKGNKNEVIF